MTIRIGVLFLALMAPCGGCGGGTDGRLDVTGAVTLAGQPLASGQIEFIAQDRTTQGSSAAVSSGQFAMSGERGLRPGQYRVVISSLQETGRQIPDPDGVPGATTAERKNVIPPEFGLESRQAVAITPDATKFDFAIP